MKNSLFIHIPKTAGTALRNFLESYVDDGKMYPNEGDLSQEEGRYYNWDEFVQSFRPAQLVCAHLPYPKLLSLYPEKPFVMTMLRHPLLRTISEILHHKRLGAANDRALSLDEIAQTRPDLFKPQWQYLGNDLEEAIANLNQCDWVGIQEHYEDSLKMLVNALALPMPEKIQKVNVRPEIDASFSIKSIECILISLHDDFLLYYHALKLFQSRQVTNFPVIEAQGRADGIKGRKIYGWARLLNSQNPADVCVYVNDVKVGSVIANIFRDDLMKKFDVNCAYEYEIPEEFSIFPGDMIRVKVVNSFVDLENSPIEFGGVK